MRRAGQEAAYSAIRISTRALSALPPYKTQTTPLFRFSFRVKFIGIFDDWHRQKPGVGKLIGVYLQYIIDCSFYLIIMCILKQQARLVCE